jgi:ribosomal protein S18 acetylase RimI-like enzyme
MINKQVSIRRMVVTDIDRTAKIHAVAFPRQKDSLEWIESNYRAFPRMQYFIAEAGENIIGFILWTQKSGFRPEAVIELEQIAVLPDRQNQGIGELLIRLSLSLLSIQLADRGATIKHIIITTRHDNTAQSLYRRVLGAEVEAVIPKLFSDDEVYMIARNITC